MALHAVGQLPEIILAQSAVAVSHTGDLNDFTFATVTIPAGLMGASGQLEIVTLWSVPNSANTKALRVKFGATAFMNAAVTTSTVVQGYTRIANRTAATQVGFPATSATFIGSSTGTLATGAVDTTADVSLTITGQLASTGETITLESYLVKLFPRP